MRRFYNVIADRKEHPREGSYTNYLFDKGIDKILKKCGEECTEIVIAAKNPDPEEIKYEISDFPLSCHGSDGRKGRYMGGGHCGIITAIKRLQKKLHTSDQKRCASFS